MAGLDHVCPFQRHVPTIQNIQKTVEVPQVQSIDKDTVEVHVVLQRQVLVFQSRCSPSGPANGLDRRCEGRVSTQKYRQASQHRRRWKCPKSLLKWLMFCQDHKSATSSSTRTQAVYKGVYVGGSCRLQADKNEVANLHFPSLSSEHTVFTQEQADCIGVKFEGSFYSGFFRYGAVSFSRVVVTVDVPVVFQRHVSTMQTATTQQHPWSVAEGKMALSCNRCGAHCLHSGTAVSTGPNVQNPSECGHSRTPSGSWMCQSCRDTIHHSRSSSDSGSSPSARAPGGDTTAYSPNDDRETPSRCSSRAVSGELRRRTIACLEWC